MTAYGDKVKMLEQALALENDKMGLLFKSGKIPTSEDWAPIRRLEKKLRTARGIFTRQLRRESPSLTKSVTVMLTEDQFDVIRIKAEAAGVKPSRYVRELIIKVLSEVEG